jgi:hypothetical protein
MRVAGERVDAPGPDVPPGGQTRYQRMSVTSPAGLAMLRSYEAGVRAMLDLPPTDPRNWYRHALVHLLDCPHGNWWFLPWHRAYLGWFEGTIRDLSHNPEFALPFWDWTAEPAVPAPFLDGLLTPTNQAYLATSDEFRARFTGPLQAFWSTLTAEQRTQLQMRSYGTVEALLGEIGGLFVPLDQARDLTKASPALDSATGVAVSIATLNSAFRARTFEMFGSDRVAKHTTWGLARILESQPHSNVHGAVGGHMGDFLSPVDPLFFLHHANLDRLWSLWTAAQTGAGRPTLPTGNALAAFTAEPFLFFSQPSGIPATLTRAGDYTKMTVFGYDYGAGTTPVVMPTFAAIAPRTVQATLQSTAMSPGQSAVAEAVWTGAMVEGLGDAVTAEVSIIPEPEARRVRYHVFLNPPAEAGILTPQDPSFAGTLFAFGGTHHGHDVTTFTLPLGSAIRALQATNAWDPTASLRLEVVPEVRGAARRPLRAVLRQVTVRVQ